MLLLKSLVSVSFFVLVCALPQPETALNVTAGCTITDYSQVNSVINSCTNIVISNLRVPANQKLDLHLKDGSTLTFRGTTSFDFGSLNDWLITISGNNINVIGEKGSLIHGHGELYWDGQGGGGGKTKPKLLNINNVNKAKFQNINLKNCPMFCTGITKATDLTIDGWIADCSDGDKGGGRNTDGIGISWSKNVYINNAYIHNQDQCVYVNQGSNMLFNKIHCVNSNGICATAGFSKTSYEENTTKNISFHNCVMEGGLTGAQVIAMGSGGLGEVSDITFQNIVFKGVRQQGIFIEMDYGTKGHPNNNIAVKNIHFNKVTGTVESGAKAVYIICGSKCENVALTGVDIKGSKVPNSCNYHPTGFNC